MKYTYTQLEAGISLVQPTGIGGDQRKYIVANARSTFRTFALSGYLTQHEALKAAREWIATVTDVGVEVADTRLEEEAREAAVREAERCVAREARMVGAVNDVAWVMKRYTVEPMHFGYVSTLGMRAISVMLGLLVMIGCTYTHPSVAQPDLVEKLSTGHVICYYKVGPSRGYAKCCEDCPMHNETVGGGDGR